MRPAQACLCAAALLLAPALPARSAADAPALTAEAPLEHYPGKFIWADLFTTNPDAARQFYTGLFGWTPETVDLPSRSGDQTQPYVILSIQGRPIAGIARRSAKAQDEAHGRWVSYLSVPDVQEALDSAESLGAHIVSSARAAPRRGTQALFEDLDGNTVGLMRSDSGDPGEYLPDPGEWAWAELFARDPERAARFYESVAGEAVMPDQRDDRPDRYALVSGGFTRAGVGPLPDRPEAHGAWLFFVRVPNVKAAAAKALSLGGHVVVPPGSTKSGDNWRAILTDPTGAQIGIMELPKP